VCTHRSPTTILQEICPASCDAELHAGFAPWGDDYPHEVIAQAAEDPAGPLFDREVRA
jgi:hypothetical protein